MIRRGDPLCRWTNVFIVCFSSSLYITSYVHRYNHWPSTTSRFQTEQRSAFYIFELYLTFRIYIFYYCVLWNGYCFAVEILLLSWFLNQPHDIIQKPHHPHRPYNHNSQFYRLLVFDLADLWSMSSLLETIIVCRQSRPPSLHYRYSIWINILCSLSLSL